MIYSTITKIKHLQFKHFMNKTTNATDNKGKGPDYSSFYNIESEASEI